MPTRLKDIAAELKLDLSTVSRALRDDPRVHADTKAKVRETAARLGYHPNLLAQRLAVGETRTIWLILPSLDSPIEQEPARHAAALLYRHGYDLLIAQHHNTPAVYERLLGRLEAGLVDGALIIPGPIADPPYEEVLVHTGYPLVFIDRHPDTIDTAIDVVTTANRAAGHELAQKLVQQGITQALVGFYENNPVGSERRIGCITALQERHIPFCELTQDKAVPDLAGQVGIFGSTQQMITRVAQGLSQATALSAGVFDQWIGGATPFQHVQVCVQDFKTMAEEAVRVLLARIHGTPEAPAIRQVPALEFIEKSRA
jgi:DNA-binding LacI/PurR family transcriptional regulator